MKYGHKIFFSFLTVFFLIVTFVFLREFSIYGNKLREIQIKESRFKAEEVFSSEKMKKGLSNRNGICEDCGMLFVFPKEDYWGLWMRDMRFDLDVIWIKNGKIADISKNISKESKDIVKPPFACDKALEINSGLIEKYGFKIGDSVIIQ